MSYEENTIEFPTLLYLISILCLANAPKKEDFDHFGFLNLWYVVGKLNGFEL